MGAYPNPSLYGEQYSFKPKGTPYHNGRECPFFNFSEFSETFLIFPISPQYREHDVSYDFVSAHLRNGLSFEEAVRLASEKRKADDFNETCRSFGVDSTTMKRRMTKGLSFQEALDFKGNMGKQIYMINGVQKPLSEWCKEYDITVPSVEYRMKKRCLLKKP